MEKIGPVAPEHLRHRIAGTPDERWWDHSGALTIGEWMRLLACLNREIGEFETIVDWGCGCGRALRHLAMKLRAGQHLIGVDVDAEAIAWVRANYPDITLFALAETPPTPLDDHSADLIVSNSIFTHLPECIADAWLAELARILRPGGLLITTVHGEKAVKQLQSSMPPDFADIMDSYGFYYIQAKNEAEAPLPDYYGGTFHSISYITRRWTKWFTIRAWLPSFALNYQDSLVLERVDVGIEAHDEPYTYEQVKIERRWIDGERLASLETRLASLQAEVKGMRETQDSLVDGVKTWLLPTLAKHGEAIARRGRLFRALGLKTRR